MATPVLTPDLCVIGAGSGGLSVAAAAASLGVPVVLIEKHKMGGDCLNTGCVPSKALIAAARRAHIIRTSAPFGIAAQEPEITPTTVNDHVQGVIAVIASHDSIERFTGLGVHVIQAPARFIDKHTVEAGGTHVKARRFIVATGSSPAIPPIPGLDQVPYFTNETIFANRAAIPHLLIIGGGPIGLEMAQAHRRLGARVTVVEAAQPLAKDDPEQASIALAALRAENIEIHAATKVTRIEQSAGQITLCLDKSGQASTISGSHLLIATGRRANISDLALDAAGIAIANGSIVVDSGLITSNRRVFAIGDVIGGAQFTHVANAHAGVVIRRALFRLPAKFNPDVIPWVTYLDPELANVGLTEATARARGLDPQIYRWPLRDNDRARAERAADGLIKVVCDRRNRILGASIVAPHAGELIQLWSLAVSQRLKISALTGHIVPYPTLGEISKRAAMTSLSAKATHPGVRRALALLRQFG